MTHEPITADSLAYDISRLGVRQGDTVMVHASLRKLGPVAGRANGVIEALDRSVGPTGTLLMNVYPAKEEPFDWRYTRADPDNGVLAEVFRLCPGTVVNRHPEGRFAARGAHAKDLVEHPPMNDYYGPGSPLERLLDMNGKILRLGADIQTTTLLHYAEYLCAVPNKRRVRRERRVMEADGTINTVAIESLDDSDGIVDWDGPDYFGLILTAYIDTGRASVGRVGAAVSELLDANDFVDFGTSWMTEHLGLFHNQQR